MLAHRIIPSLLCRGRELVKGRQFDSWRSVGHAAQAVKVHQMRKVDELLLIDIGATPEGRGPDLDLVKELAEVCMMPLSVGGGIKTIEQVHDLLRAGADKVVIGTALWADPHLGMRISKSIGSQVLAAAVDHSHGCVYTDCGQTRRKARPEFYARTLETIGAGEILLTSIEQEGTIYGYDLNTIEMVANRVDIPVIAHGGCRDYEDMRKAIERGAHAVAAGALFQFTDATPAGAAEYLAEHGVQVRDPREASQHELTG